MREFNLEEYLVNPNQKIATRDGRAVEILCTDRNDEYSIVALVATQDGKEQVYCYFPNGRHYKFGEDCRDLMFAPTKKEGWINLYKCKDNIITDKFISHSEKDALIQRDIYKDSYIATVKIEWEE